MVSVCLPSDVFLQHLLSYLGFSYLGHGVFLHGCFSKLQLLLLTLDEGYLLRAAPSDLERGVAPLDPPAPVHPPLLGYGVAPLGRHHLPRGFPHSSVGKEFACNAGDRDSIPGSGKSPGEGNGIHCSILAWKIPWTEEPGGLQSMGLKSQTRLSV